MLNRPSQSGAATLEPVPEAERAPARRQTKGAAARAMAADPVPGGPRHVAVIMDGNGRWASARGLPRLEGHRRGARAVREIVEACPDIGVETLTLYAFSTENWRRPAEEVSGLMDLFRGYLRKETDELTRNGVRVVFPGDRAPLAEDIRFLMEEVERKTAEGRRLTVAIAMNYGARAEIARAARRIAAAAAAGEIEPDDVDETAFSAAMTQELALPEPDLLIRTGGDHRLSNFLLWQAAYAELMFVPETWPDFSAQHLRRAAEAFACRERRFGGL